MKSKATILVVEDEKPLYSALTKKLKLCGFNVLVARDVKSALEQLGGQEKIDLVWLDHYLLGKEDGLDLVAEMRREDSKWKDIAIFVVSNTASPDKVKSYMNLGVEKYFIKANSRLDDVIEDINEVLKKSSHLQ